jgi:hypothetical protein
MTKAEVGARKLTKGNQSDFGILDFGFAEGPSTEG